MRLYRKLNSAITRPINGSMPVYDRHMIDVVIDRWDEFAKKLKDGEAPVFTI